MPTKYSIDPSQLNIREDQWELASMSADGFRRTMRHWIDRERGTYIERTENLIEPDIIASNQQEYNDSAGKRFGDWRRVARIPLNVFYKHFPERMQQGDNDFKKWFLNRDENRPYRTFRGKI